MNGRAGLERFRKAQTLEPFSVTSKSSHKQTTEPLVSSIHPQSSHQETPYKNQLHDPQKTVGPEVTAPAVPGPQVTQVGGGQSTWQPPDWAIEPRPGVYYLEVLKDGEVLGQINLDKRRHIFGRQFPMCDFVLDHQSISRQHAAVVPHMNGRLQHNNMDEMEQKPPKINLQQMNPKINIPGFDLDEIKKHSQLLVSPSLKETKGKQSARWKNCLCSPTTHVGSFRCRHHRSSSLQRGGSVGSKLSELARKSRAVSDSLQAQ